MSKYMNGFQVVIMETCPEESGCLVPPGHNLPSSQVNIPQLVMCIFFVSFLDRF